MSSFSTLPSTTSQLNMAQDGQQAPLILVDGFDGFVAPMTVLYVAGSAASSFDGNQLNLTRGSTNVIIIDNTQGLNPVLLTVTTTGSAVQNILAPVAAGQWGKVYLVPQALLTVTVATLTPIIAATPINVFLRITHT